MNGITWVDLPFVGFLNENSEGCIRKHVTQKMLYHTYFEKYGNGMDDNNELPQMFYYMVLNVQ